MRPAGRNTPSLPAYLRPARRAGRRAQIRQACAAFGLSRYAAPSALCSPCLACLRQTGGRSEHTRAFRAFARINKISGASRASDSTPKANSAYLSMRFRIRKNLCAPAGNHPILNMNTNNKAARMLASAEPTPPAGGRRRRRENIARQRGVLPLAAIAAPRKRICCKAANSRSHEKNIKMLHFIIFNKNWFT